jgi:hypothetical protein
MSGVEEPDVAGNFFPFGGRNDQALRRTIGEYSA